MAGRRWRRWKDEPEPVLDVKILARHPRLRAAVKDDSGEVHEVLVVRVPGRGDVGICTCRRAGGSCQHFALVRAVASDEQSTQRP